MSSRTMVGRRILAAAVCTWEYWFGESYATEYTLTVQSKQGEAYLSAPMTGTNPGTTNYQVSASAKIPK